jgi:hypothetical protein
VGRQRCQRYADRHFVIHWVIDDDTDLNYLDYFGATIIPSPIAAIIPEAGSRWEIAKQSILDAILKLKHDGAEVSQKKLAKHLGRDAGSLGRLLKRHDINLIELIDTVEQGLSSVYKDSTNKWQPPGTQSTKEFWHFWSFHLQAKPGEILEDLASVVASQGWDKWVEILRLYPIECQAKTVAILSAQLSLENEAEALAA